MALQLFGVADAGEHEQLWGVECAGGDDDFAAGGDVSAVFVALVGVDAVLDGAGAVGAG